MSIPLTEIERINVLLPTELFAGSKDWRVGSIADRVDWLLTMYASAKEEVERLQSALEVQPLPFGVGGGLVAIKTLLSRDPCAHANTAIQMIDAILAGTAPLAQPQQELEYCTDYHCAGDCGQPHNQKEMQEFLASQPQQEPVAWIWKYANGEEEVVFVPPRHVDATHIDAPSTITPLYTSPPARKPLTKSQVLDLWEQTYVQRGTTGIEFARAIEAAHGIKEQP